MDDEEDTDENNNYINFQTNNPNEKIAQNLISKFNLSSKIINKPHKNKYHNKTYKSILNPNANQYLTNDPIYIEDFLLSIRIRFDDVFQKMEGSEKLFKDIQEEEEKQEENNVIKGAVLLRKLNFNENFKKKKKIDVNKVIEIQKFFKGYIVRNIDEKSNRLRIRQCLIELFCLLIYGYWCKAKLRYYIGLLESYYKIFKTVFVEELSFSDKLTFKLPKCFYSGTKINNLGSTLLGKNRELIYNNKIK